MHTPAMCAKPDSAAPAKPFHLPTVLSGTHGRGALPATVVPCHVYRGSCVVEIVCMVPFLFFFHCFSLIFYCDSSSMNALGGKRKTLDVMAAVIKAAT